MKTSVLVLAVLLLAVSCGKKAEKAESLPPLPPLRHFVGAALLRQHLERGHALLILDIRREADYAAGHLPGAVNLPLAEVRPDPTGRLPAARRRKIGGGAPPGGSPSRATGRDHRRRGARGVSRRGPGLLGDGPGRCLRLPRSRGRNIRLGGAGRKPGHRSLRPAPGGGGHRGDPHRSAGSRRHRRDPRGDGFSRHGPGGRSRAGFRAHTRGPTSCPSCGRSTAGGGSIARCWTICSPVRGYWPRRRRS
ncbi:MAG: rhodanese-like domain-containing protein [Acidobacteriota bacterium]|nr:rhodanese-like domain-containing protein [Acidobacteriota bacterium]